MTVTMEKPAPQEMTSPCQEDPDRWSDSGDDPELKTLCRGCQRRWLCANEALNTPGIQGMVAAVHIPENGRARAFALRQIQSLAAYGGYASQPQIP